MADTSLSTRLAAALADAGVDTMFGLPGGGPNLDLIGAATDRGLRFVLAHGETEAAIMASTYGLLTGTPTPVVVTRGPGAASLTNGLAQATLDRYPLVAVTDTVPERSAARVAHQRLDQRAMLAPVAKGAATISDATSDADLDGLIDRARRWPYGAVHLDADVTAPWRTAGPDGPGAAVSLSGSGGLVDAATMADARRLLDAAERPIVIVGMEAAALAASASGVSEQLAAFGCPVLTTYQAIGTVPTEGPANAGLFTNGALERPVLDGADLVVTVGLDLVEPIPARWTLDAPVLRLSATTQTDAYLPATVDLVGDLASAIAELSAHARQCRWSWLPSAAGDFRTAARTHLLARPTTPSASRAAFGPCELVGGLIEVVPDDATVTVDAGAHFLAVMPLWPVAGPFGLLISNGLATMGFAIPAAIGAALARPDAPVVALTGDGGLAMVLGELETVGRLRLPITVVVFNDGALSLIEIKQRPGHGGPAAVRYAPTDFAAIADAVGIPGSVVSSTDELQAALGQTPPPGPRLIDARIDPTDYRHLITATRG